MKKESSAIKRLCDLKAKVSSHYFIRNNGKILNLVPDLYKAWHAGISYWKNYRLLNQHSIGIEINNPGHDNTYKKFSLKQINSLIKLLKYLIKKYKIKEYKFGVRPATRDRRPFVGKHSNIDNLYILNGLGSKGVSQSPHCSKELLNYIEFNKNLDQEINIERIKT